MTTAVIDPTLLKTVRKSRKLGRPRLAKMTGLTERQIARLEGAQAARNDTSDAVMLRISQALQVPVGVLTGELPLTDADLTPAEKPSGSSCGCCP